MSSQAASGSIYMSRFEQLRLGREVVRQEGKTLLEISTQLDDAFCDAADVLFGCMGSVLVCGMGKAGLVGQKIAATLASTGTRSHFLHPAEAIHGDLGRVHPNDVLLLLSCSGETEEITRLLPLTSEVSMIAITGDGGSTLARRADVVLDLGKLREADPLDLAPTSSTTAMMAVGDALALVASRMKNFTAGDFARYHPGGSLGRKLSCVDDVMRPLEQCRVALESHSVRDALVEVGRPGRRTGAVMLVDSRGVLTGLFTDSDLAKMLEERREDGLDAPVASLMTRDPMTVAGGSLLSEAVSLLASQKISELPVVDRSHRPLGLLDITDVVGLAPKEESQPTIPFSRPAS